MWGREGHIKQVSLWELPKAVPNGHEQVQVPLTLFCNRSNATHQLATFTAPFYH
jgi:hypothetical protein